ncbi:MAG: hypothetical protein ACYC09_03230 [Bacteroidota bacterium]
MKSKFRSSLYLSSIKLFLLSIVLSLLSSSCKENATEAIPYYEEKIFYSNTTMPLAVGNTWAYADSTFISFTKDSMYIKTDLVVTKIVGYREINGIGRWQYGYDNNDAFCEYYVLNDTIYVHQLSPNGTFLKTRIAFLPSNNEISTRTFQGPYPNTSTKVFRLTEDILTPAGTFKNIFVYEEEYYGAKIMRYVCPGIGEVKVDVYESNKLTSRRYLVFVRLRK